MLIKIKIALISSFSHNWKQSSIAGKWDCNFFVPSLAEEYEIHDFIFIQFEIWNESDLIGNVTKMYWKDLIMFWYLLDSTSISKIKISQVSKVKFN